MIGLALVLVLVAVGIVLGRKGGAAAPRGVDQLYIGFAIVPFVLTILAPITIGLVWGYDPEKKRWIDVLSRIGLTLSALLAVWGGLLVVRAVGRGTGWGWPLGAAVVLAAGPAVLLLAGWTLRYGLERWP